MKNKTKIITTVAFGVLGLSISVVPFFHNEKVTETSGYTGSSCPTTIKLKAPDESVIRNYYSDLLSLDVSEKQGTNLLKNLKPILMEDQKYYNYDSGGVIWQMYEITDRDWEKSPADQIPSGYGTYNSVTETITNYVYGSSTSSKGSNPYIHALYVNRDYSGGNGARAWDSHGKRDNMWTIEREHIWAKANGFDTDGAAGARGDPMHLWAANGTANGSHSNNYFGYVDTTKGYTDNGKTHDNIKGNLSGISKTKGSGTVFEPQDCDKGDIARAVFYMVARYNNYAGETAGFSTDNPNLTLANNLSENSRTGTSDYNDPYSMGLLSDLLAWNKLDPVDEYEVHRNNLLYKNYTNNRNPFIDFPEWAEYIWGTANYDGTGYNSTPKGAAKPATDVIGQAGDTFEVSAEDIKFSVGETVKVSGKNADADIAWSVDDNSVVSIDKTSTVNDEEVTVTALKNGTTTIRASAYAGGDLINKTISVTVNDLIIESISVSGMKTEFKVGEEFSTEGLKVKVNYKNGTSEEVTTGFTVSKPDMNKEGEQTVTVTYQDISVTYKINIAKAPIPMLYIYIGVGAGVLILIILIVVFVKGSKKTKKKMLKAAKKGAKAYKKSKK